MRLTDRRILITGGGSGIGLALVRALAPENRVVIAGRDEARLEEARASTPRLEAIRLDVTSEQDAARAIGEFGQGLGGLDVLINSAGVMHAGAIDGAGADASAVQDVEINLLGTIRVTRLALPLLRRSDDGASCCCPRRSRWSRHPGWRSTRPRRRPCTRLPAHCGPS